MPSMVTIQPWLLAMMYFLHKVFNFCFISHSFLIEKLKRNNVRGRIEPGSIKMQWRAAHEAADLTNTPWHLDSFKFGLFQTSSCHALMLYALWSYVMKRTAPISPLCVASFMDGFVCGWKLKPAENQIVSLRYLFYVFSSKVTFTLNIIVK